MQDILGKLGINEDEAQQLFNHFFEKLIQQSEISVDVSSRDFGRNGEISTISVTLKTPFGEISGSDEIWSKEDAQNQ